MDEWFEISEKTHMTEVSRRPNGALIVCGGCLGALTGDERGSEQQHKVTAEVNHHPE